MIENDDIVYVKVMCSAKETKEKKSTEIARRLVVKYSWFWKISKDDFWFYLLISINEQLNMKTRVVEPRINGGLL